MTAEVRCQSMVRTLLSLQSVAAADPKYAAAYIVEAFEAAGRCSALKQVHDDYTERLGVDGALERILGHTSTDADRRLAQNAVRVLAPGHRPQLLRELQRGLSVK